MSRIPTPNASTRLLHMMLGAGMFPMAVEALTFAHVPQTEAASVLIEAPDGHIVRTLLADEPIQATPKGTIEVDWDGKDDFGNTVPPGHYTAKLIGNSIHFVWEGTLGNSSRDAAVGGEHIFRSFEPIRQLAVDPKGNAFFVTGYNEQGLHFHRFAMGDPHVPSDFLFDDFTRSFTSVDTDGEKVYFANVGTVGSLNCPGAINQATTTFLAATSVADNSPYLWNGHATRIGGMPGASGTWFGVDAEFNKPSADCSSADNLAAPSRWRLAANGGVAVQRHGPHVFTAHTDQDVVNVLDKYSGRLDATISVVSPASICTAADDSVWVLSQAKSHVRVLHYRGTGKAWKLEGSIDSGFSKPLAIGCNRADGSIAIIDAATMQVRDFSSDGKLHWTLGKRGGHIFPAPDVSNARFGFVPGYSYIAFLDDGSFWLGDPFNFRSLLFSPSGGALKDQIAYLPASYRVAVDRSDPARVFAQFLEYSVDYAKPLAQSWTLVRNWASGLGSDYVPSDAVNTNAGIQRPFRLNNGRTYATVFNFRKNAKEIVELDPANGLRPTGILLPFGMQMYAGGVLRHDGRQAGNCGNPCRIYERTLAGFDDRENPHWNSDTVVAMAPGMENIDPVHSSREASDLSETAYPETVSHRIIFFNAGRTKGFHLGAVYRNKDSWNWRASPIGPFRTKPGMYGQLDIIPHGSAFPIDNNGIGLPEPAPTLSYAGGTVDAQNNIVVFSYPGEGWNGAEASQFMVFEEGGAKLGQFGHPGYPSINRLRSVPGFAGNAYGVILVWVEGKAYVYVNDESGSGGIQRWQIKGLDTIFEIRSDVNIEP